MSARLRPFPFYDFSADCSEVKGLFEKLGVAAKVVELDELADGGKVQEALQQLTGRRTVPQVGGCARECTGACAC